LQVEVKGEVGVWGEVEVFELMDLYQHQPCQELFEVDSGVVTRWFIDFSFLSSFQMLSRVATSQNACTMNIVSCGPSS
jgi:hypothetical protein